MNSSDNLQNILNYLLEKSNISIDEVLNNMEDMNNAKILKQHAYKLHKIQMVDFLPILLMKPNHLKEKNC
jgi:hypothetical protein